MVSLQSNPWPASRICPHCKSHSQADWVGLMRNSQAHLGWSTLLAQDPSALAALGFCYACGRVSLHDKAGKLLWPENIDAPEAHDDMPPKIRELYEEARSISERSPRAAAALLRLCAELLLKEEGFSGSFKSMISKLRDSGGSRRLIRALDSVRIIGNEEVHAGEIYLDDNEEDQAAILFVLINLIVDDFYARDVVVDAVYQRLPESKKIDKE